MDGGERLRHLNRAHVLWELEERLTATLDVRLNLQGNNQNQSCAPPTDMPARCVAQTIALPILPKSREWRTVERSHSPHGTGESKK